MCAVPPGGVGLQGFHSVTLTGHWQGGFFWGGVHVILAIASHTLKFKPSLLQANPSGTALSQRENSLILSSLPASFTCQCSICESQHRSAPKGSWRWRHHGARWCPSQPPLIPSTFWSPEHGRRYSSCHQDLKMQTLPLIT